METKIIDGKALALEHEKILKQKLDSLRASPEYSRPPKIVSFFGSDDASKMYTKMKKKKAEELGIIFEDIPQTSRKEVVDKMAQLNDDPSIDGIMMQLPLLSSLEPYRGYLLNLINPKKDIDGLGGQGEFLQATVRGVISILESEALFNKHLKFIVIGGVRGMVGVGLVKELGEKRENVLGVSRADPKVTEISKTADILISSTGIKDFVTPGFVKRGATVIDVGGDVDFEKVKGVADRITPPIGGVGPMTVISLMENVVESFENRR